MMADVKPWQSFDFIWSCVSVGMLDVFSLQVHVLIADTLAKIFLIQLFLEGQNSTVKHNPIILPFYCQYLSRVSHAYTHTKITQYLFGFDHFLNVLQLLLQLPLLFAWQSRLSPVKSKKEKKASKSKKVVRFGIDIQAKAGKNVNKAEHHHTKSSACAEILFSYLKEKRAMTSRRKERKTSPPQPYNCCSTERESNTFTTGVCGLQEQQVKLDCCLYRLWYNFGKPVDSCMKNHQIEWESLRALTTQSHLQQLLGKSAQHQ